MTPYQFGVECEVSQGAGDVLAHLHEGGHVTDTHLHAYHCGKGYSRGCDACEPTRSGPDWTGQEDCTADGEFISRILTTGPEGDRALATIADALVKGRAEQNDRVGMHIHTDAGPFADDTASLVRLWRLWMVYQDDIGNLARGKSAAVRGYNGPNVTKHGDSVRCTGVLSYGSDDATVRQFYEGDHDDAYQLLDSWVRTGPRTGRWLSGGVEAGTFEFRLWNGSRSLWRIRTAVYVSVALTTAALDGYEARPDDGRSLLDALGDRLPDDVYLSIFRQLTPEG